MQQDLYGFLAKDNFPICTAAQEQDDPQDAQRNKRCVALRCTRRSAEKKGCAELLSAHCAEKKGCPEKKDTALLYYNNARSLLTDLAYSSGGHCNVSVGEEGGSTVRPVTAV